MFSSLEEFNFISQEKPIVEHYLAKMKKDGANVKIPTRPSVHNPIIITRDALSFLHTVK
jgi:hypothetical protein